MGEDLNDRLSSFFEPKSILIVGASRTEFTFNWTLVKNLREARYNGELMIIHPVADEILGVKCYKKLEELPIKPELAIFLLGHDLEQYIVKMAQFGIKNFMLEADITDKQNTYTILKNLENIADKYNLKIMGPSMIGIINMKNFFTSSIIPVRRHILSSYKRSLKNCECGLSFLAQSGGLSGAMGWWIPSQPIPCSKIIHTGRSINVKDAEILEYLFNDTDTRVISLYLKDPTKELIKVLEKYAYKKPVLFKMVGKAIDMVDDLKQFGAIPVDNYIELFEYAKPFLWCPPPKGNRLGIIGPSSGAIHLIIAEMRKNNLHLARLTPETKSSILNKVGGSTCIEGNPIDYWPPRRFIGTDVCSIYYRSSNLLLSDDTVDALFLALEFFSEIEFDFDIFAEIKKKFPDKPIITILIQAEKEGAERITKCASQLNIPVYDNEPERAVKAYAAFLDFYKKKNEKFS